MLIEYLVSLKQINRAIRRINHEMAKIDTTKIGSFKLIDELKFRRSWLTHMAANLKYSIEYMKLGHEPVHWQGIPNLRCGEGDIDKRKI